MLAHDPVVAIGDPCAGMRAEHGNISVGEGLVGQADLGNQRRLHLICGRPVARPVLKEGLGQVLQRHPLQQTPGFRLVELRILEFGGLLFSGAERLAGV